MTKISLFGGALLLVMLLSACGSGSSVSSQPYALRGTPAINSGTDTANFIIGNGQCRFVALVGYASNAATYAFPCKVTSDEPNALGDPHSHVSIAITTSSGVQTAKIDSTTTGLVTSQTPDLGFAFPPSWTVTAPVSAITLRNNDTGNTNTHVTISVQGVECAVTINDSPVNCGLSYWNEASLSLWVSGTLVSSSYAGSVIGLTFAKGASDQWKLKRSPAGFPAEYNNVHAADK